MSVQSSERKCLYCSSNEIENLYHFVKDCESFNTERIHLCDDVELYVHEESLLLFNGLPRKIKYFIIMGMDYQMCSEDLFRIRCLSAYYVNIMYRKRKNLLT